MGNVYHKNLTGDDLHVNKPLTIANVTEAYNILATDEFVNCNGTFTITLPTAAGVSGKIYFIKNEGTGIVTINTTSNQTIDDDSNLILDSQYDCVQLVSDGSNWRMI